MSTNPNLLSLEAAVARMINLDYIPEGFTLLDMTEAFMLDAKEQYERGQFIGLPSDEVFRLKYRYKACEARHQLAQTLLTGIYSEFSTADDLGCDTLTSISDLGPSVYLDNLSDWAAEIYGISLQPAPVMVTNIVQGSPSTQQHWEDITIKIYADNYLGYIGSDGNLKKVCFSDVGLLGKRKNQANHLSGLLIGFSHGKKFPMGTHPLPKEKTLISKLRGILKKLVDIQDDPFKQFKPDKGWKPKFKIIDDRKNAANRAKERAVHVPFEDDRDRPFDHEDDDAGRLILDNQ